MNKQPGDPATREHAVEKNDAPATVHKLSSSATWMTKFVLPMIFIAIWPVWLSFGLARGGYDWIPAAAWGIGCLLLLVWSWPIKTVKLDGDVFVISNYLTQHSIPAGHLRHFAQHRMSRTPTITLHFEPPT